MKVHFAGISIKKTKHDYDPGKVSFVENHHHELKRNSNGQLVKSRDRSGERRQVQYY
jgi:hypothetical protein